MTRLFVVLLFASSLFLLSGCGLKGTGRSDSDDIGTAAGTIGEGMMDGYTDSNPYSTAPVYSQQVWTYTISHRSKLAINSVSRMTIIGVSKLEWLMMANHHVELPDNNAMHAKSGLRVVLKWKIYRPDSVIAAVIHFWWMDFYAILKQQLVFPLSHT